MNRGEIVKLGKHRLKCGDACEEDEVWLLMNGMRADLCLTDPPYMLNMQSWKAGAKVGSIDVELMNQSRYFERWFRSVYEVLREDGIFMCFGNYRSSIVYFMTMLRTGFSTYDPIIWDKEYLQPGSVNFRNVYEVVNVGFKGKATITDRTAKNIYTQGWFSTHGLYNHPAEKPEAFCRWLIQKGSPTGGTVVDLFGGSGTTLAACEREGRKCLMMEISPEYCDVIIRRYEDMTGRKPESESQLCHK
ncbi:MAG: site-specific DNA-methyltransferase [Synergistaceae bacterium]|nr:site-specific DNA-methyltransferase [Synergistaceae bacterium]